MSDEPRTMAEVLAEAEEWRAVPPEAKERFRTRLLEAIFEELIVLGVLHPHRAAQIVDGATESISDLPGARVINRHYQQRVSNCAAAAGWDVERDPYFEGEAPPAAPGG